jgi:hypothetical protein
MLQCNKGIGEVQLPMLQCNKGIGEVQQPMMQYNKGIDEVQLPIFPCNKGKGDVQLPIICAMYALMSSVKPIIFLFGSDFYQIFLTFSHCNCDLIQLF